MRKLMLVAGMIVLLAIVAGCTLPLVNDNGPTINKGYTYKDITPFVVPARLRVTAPPRSAIKPQSFPTQTLSYDTILKAIRREFGSGGYVLEITDTQWRAYTWYQIMGFLLYDDNTNEIPYQKNYFDCDDFAKVTLGDIAKALPGVAFGMLIFEVTVTTPPVYHAVDFFYMPDFYQRIICFEPQGDAAFWFDPHIYKALWVFI